MIEALIRFALSNFTLNLLVIGLIASAIAYYSKPAPRARAGGRGLVLVVPVFLDRRQLFLQFRTARFFR
jgi:hypothetical protein